jgi:hypothetical protein
MQDVHLHAKSSQTNGHATPQRAFYPHALTKHVRVAKYKLVVYSSLVTRAACHVMQAPLVEATVSVESTGRVCAILDIYVIRRLDHASLCVGIGLWHVRRLVMTEIWRLVTVSYVVYLCVYIH